MCAEYLFTRHGQSTANLTGTIANRASDPAPLTDLGRQQAGQLLVALLPRHVIAVYASPLLRARQTGEILAAGLGLPVQLAEALREPFCGEAEGRSDPDAWRMHAEQEQAWRAGQFDHRIPGGESFNDVRARFVPFMAQVIARHAAITGTVVLVSHGSTLANMLPLVVANLDRAFFDAHPLSNCATLTARQERDQLICVEWCGLPLGTISAAPRSAAG